MEKMANVSLTESNSFINSTDGETIQTKVIANFITSGHYINADLDLSTDSSLCKSTITLESCAKVVLSDALISTNSCSSLLNNKTAGLALIGITDSFAASRLDFYDQFNVNALSSALYIEAK